MGLPTCVLTLVGTAASSDILRPRYVDDANGSLLRWRVGPVGLQHRYPSGPHTSRDNPRGEMGSRADMVLRRYRFHHCHHSASFRLHQFSLGQDPDLDTPPASHRRGQHGTSAVSHRRRLRTSHSNKTRHQWPPSKAI